MEQSANEKTHATPVGPSAMTVIEIRPHRWSWKAFKALRVEPVFPKKDQAIGYAQNRA